jgi:predicted restriction endonuclease
MTTTEQKLQKLSMNYGQQKQSGWYLCRLSALPSMRSHGRFNRVVREQGYRCAICNTINPHLTIDHRLPKIRGGTSDIDNLQLLCLEHHRCKDNKLKKVKKNRSYKKLNLVSCLSKR